MRIASVSAHARGAAKTAHSSNAQKDCLKLTPGKTQLLSSYYRGGKPADLDRAGSRTGGTPGERRDGSPQLLQGERLLDAQAARATQEVAHGAGAAASDEKSDASGNFR